MTRIRTYILMLALCAGIAGARAYAQENRAERFAERYNLLVSKLGADGVGIETLLNAWAAEDSTDLRLYTARFSYYFAKSQADSVVSRHERKYLGMSPILQLKDSTGTDVYYFQERFYDDSLFSIAIKTADKAIRMWPDRLDLRLLKADALSAYEKGSPDMTSAYLESLADEYFSGGKQWTYPGDTVDDAFFKGIIQQYCASFFSLGTRNSYEAFRQLAETMLGYLPDDPTFMSDIGSYLLIARSDYKGALKCYNKVLKTSPEDYTAIKNCIIVARHMKNVRMEKKYLAMMAEYGPETEKKAAAVRLGLLSGKKR